MVAVTIPLAVTAIAMVVFGSALALLSLQYRGEEFLRWLSQRAPRHPVRSALGDARGADPARRFAGHSGQRGVAAVVPPGNPMRGIELLRIGLGVVWAVNLLFIVLPAAGYWSTFQGAAQSYGASTLGGPGLAGLVAAHATLFAWLIALTTAYLAAAFLLGVTTRLACGVGAVMSIAFFVTQFGATFVFPGGTDVGPHPLYLAIYAALWVGGAGRVWAIDGMLWTREWTRRVPHARWFASLPPTDAI